MSQHKNRKDTRICLSIVQSAAVFTVGAYGAIAVALLSGVPSLEPGSWQEGVYPILFKFLAYGIVPTMAAMFMLMLGADVRDYLLEMFLERPRIFFRLYMAILIILIGAAWSFVAYGFGYLSGSMASASTTPASVSLHLETFEILKAKSG